MITTLTLNPSIDRTVMLDVLRVGEVQRVLDSRLEPGGKGINIARALSTNGTAARAIFPIDAAAKPDFLAELVPLGAICSPFDRVERTRTNLSITEQDGTTTKLNESGAALKPALLDGLLQAAATAEGDGIVAAAGSLPSGADVGTYAELAKRMASPERNLAFDTSGAPLKAMVGAPCAVAKPNLEELESLVQTSLRSFGAVIEAATELHHGGWAAVLVSLGADGALLIDGEGVHHGRADVDAVRNTVGAGDATLAGYLAARAAGDNGPRALAEALAWAHAAVTSPGTGAPPVSERDRAAVALTASIEPKLRVEGG